MHRMVRCIIALAILVGSYGQTVAQAPVSVAQHPLAGARVFGAKGCVKCHAVNGVGGTLGPDLGRNLLSHSFFGFAAAMPQLSAPEMADLMAFLQGLGEGQE
jgi:mono/diheme cytochrome c family protein